MKKFGWFALLFLVCAGTALAAQAVVAPAATEGTAGLLKGIGAGMLTGIVAAGLGFAKDTAPDKKWDFKTAGSTVLIGAIVGAFAGWQKKDLTTAADWFNSGSVVVLAELVWKAVWRNAGAPALGHLVGYVKTGAGTPPPKP